MDNLYPLDVFSDLAMLVRKSIPDMTLKMPPCADALSLATTKFIFQLNHLNATVQYRHGQLHCKSSDIEFLGNAPEAIPCLRINVPAVPGSFISETCCDVFSEMTETFGELKQHIAGDLLTGPMSLTYARANRLHKKCESFLKTHADIIDAGPILVPQIGPRGVQMQIAYASAYPRSTAG